MEKVLKLFQLVPHIQIHACTQTDADRKRKKESVRENETHLVKAPMKPRKKTCFDQEVELIRYIAESRHSSHESSSDL